MHGSGPYNMPYNRHGPRQPMAALARGLGAACRISVARLRPAESDVRGMSSTLSKTVGAVRQVRVRPQFRESLALIDLPDTRLRPLDLYIVGELSRRRTRRLQ